MGKDHVLVFTNQTVSFGELQPLESYNGKVVLQNAAVLPPIDNMKSMRSYISEGPPLFIDSVHLFAAVIILDYATTIIHKLSYDVNSKWLDFVHLSSQANSDSKGN